MPHQKLVIAMLDDDKDDHLLTKETIGSLGYEVEIKFFVEGNQMLADLPQTMPHLILLDYNSVPENGFQVLKKIKSDPALRHIPVVMLGDSDGASYRKECHSAGAASFIVKPSSIDLTKKKIGTFLKYWTEVAEI